MKETMKLFNKARKILASGIFLAILVTSCHNGFLEPVNGTGGNVTITIDGLGERTLRPNDITPDAFERIEVSFTKDSVVKILLLNKGQGSGSINLESGLWSINALGFTEIEGREYEAAQGSASVNVGSVSTTVGISLKTGIFDGKPGVFSYNTGYPDDANEAVLEIAPLNDLYGHANPNAGKTVNLLTGQSGSFELSPGYYLLTITAKTGGMMAVWNELVHIYSGRETSAPHAFIAGDFSGTVTLSGVVFGGELEGNRITEAVITAYGDDKYMNRIANVSVSGFTKMAVAPYYYSAAWSVTVPSYLIEKNLYFRVDETISGSAGIKTYTRNSETVEVSANGNTGIELYLDYVWGNWLVTGDGISEDSMTCTVQQDGSIKVKTDDTIENEWENWRYGLWYSYPVENGIAYAHEFEAWTESGELELEFVYVDYYQDTFSPPNASSKSITINEDRQTFTIISETRINSDVDPAVKFFAGSETFTGTFYIKMNLIKSSRDYTPPAQGGNPRFTAEPVSEGMKLSVDLRDLPDELEGIAFLIQENLSMFEMDWRGNIRPDTYEMIFPYVESGKTYTFELQWRGGTIFQMSSIIHTPVTATGGRGELKFSNASELALVKDGNILKLNKAPAVSSLPNDAQNGTYDYNIVTGTSWQDIYSEWKYNTSRDNPNEEIDLLDTDNLPLWYYPKDFSAVMGKTCFANLSYHIEYTDSDIYLSTDNPDLFGTFIPESISSTPFVYPNTIPGAFTAEPCDEGIRLTVDLTLIPVSSNAIHFHPADWSNQCYIGANTWKEPYGSFYGEDKISIIYPFVEPGKTYTFAVEYSGTGAFGEATVTTTAGLGELIISNRENTGMAYNSGTKTLSLTGTPEELSFNSQKIDSQFWEWQFFRGRNFDGSEYAGYIQNKPLKPSFVFNNTFDSVIGAKLSNKYAFVTLRYVVYYEGIKFETDFISSQPFRFPEFDADADYITSNISSAFDTNSNLWFDSWGSVSKGEELYARIEDRNWYSHDPFKSYIWYIDGVEQADHTNDEEYLPTDELEPGIHYGLAVIIIDGVPFAKEFAFRVWN